MAVLDIDSRTKTAYIFCDVVAEDYRAHGGFARAALTHEQHLFLLLAGVHVGICRLNGRRGFAVRFVFTMCRNTLQLLSLFGFTKFAFQSPKLS